MENQKTVPTDMEIYLFDLRGYIILKNAVTKDLVCQLNKSIDQLLPLEIGQWSGYVHGHRYGETDGFNLQQIYEAGPEWEELIDHPAWIEKVKHFIGGSGTFDYHHGPLFIDENFVNIRGPGESIGIHSGAHSPVKRTQFLFRNGQFMCGQINIFLALTDMGPGDGCTVVIPGSHKANFKNPEVNYGVSGSVDAHEASVEVHLTAGDALLFVDAISHGSSARKNPGQRRNALFRYGPSWGNFRHGYQPSKELLDRLTPERRQIIWPQHSIPNSPYKTDNL